MKRTLLSATTALAFAFAPAAAQVVGGEAEVDTDTNIETDFANDGAETRTGVSTDIKVDPGQYDMPDSKTGADIRAQAPSGTTGEDHTGQRAALDGKARMGAKSSIDIEANIPDRLTRYEIGQIRKAGPEAVADIDTITRGDLTYE
jgi:hypothetical protein